MTAKIVRAFAIVWFCLAGGVICASNVAIVVNDGISKLQEIWSPFNVLNFLVVIVTLSPGLGAWWLAERLQDRERPRRDA